MKFEIQPMNEGQEMNYRETFTGTKAEAQQRAKDLAKGLKRLMPKGDFSCHYESASIRGAALPNGELMQNKWP